VGAVRKRYSQAVEEEIENSKNGHETQDNLVKKSHARIDETGNRKKAVGRRRRKD